MKPVQWVRIKGRPGEAFRCPVCSHKTLRDRGNYEICPICFWEDDGQDDPDADRMLGGPNWVSLTDARKNFALFGAVEERFKKNVRPPRPDEI